MVSTSPFFPPTRPVFDLGKSAFLVLFRISGLSVLFVVLSALATIRSLTVSEFLSESRILSHDLSVRCNCCAIVRSVQDQIRAHNRSVINRLNCSPVTVRSRPFFAPQSANFPRNSLSNSLSSLVDRPSSPSFFIPTPTYSLIGSIVLILHPFAICTQTPGPHPRWIRKLKLC